MTDLSERHHRMLHHHLSGRRDCFTALDKAATGLDRTVWVGAHPAYRAIIVPRRPTVALGERPLMANLGDRIGVKLVDQWVEGNLDVLTSYAQREISPMTLLRRIWWIDRDNPPITDFSKFRIVPSWPQRVDLMGKSRDRRRRVMRQHSRQSLGEGVEVSLWSCKLEDDPTPWRPYRCPMEFTGLDPDSHYRLLIRWGEYASTGPYAAIYVDVDGVAVLFDRCVAVETFIAAVKRFPVHVPIDQDYAVALQQSAHKRNIPCCRFLDAVGFRTADEAMMAKLTMPA